MPIRPQLQPNSAERASAEANQMLAHREHCRMIACNIIKEQREKSIRSRNHTIQLAQFNAQVDRLQKEAQERFESVKGNVVLLIPYGRIARGLKRLSDLITKARRSLSNISRRPLRFPDPLTIPPLNDLENFVRDLRRIRELDAETRRVLDLISQTTTEVRRELSFNERQIATSIRAYRADGCESRIRLSSAVVDGPDRCR